MVKWGYNRDRTLRKQYEARYLTTCVLRRNDGKRLVPSWQIFNCLQSTATNGVVRSKSSKTTGNLLKLSNTWCTRRVTQSLSSKNLVVQDLWLVGKFREKSHTNYICVMPAEIPFFAPFQKGRQGITKRNCLVHLWLSLLDKDTLSSTKLPHSYLVRGQDSFFPSNSRSQKKTTFCLKTEK